MTLEQVAKIVLNYRTSFPSFYGSVVRVEAVIYQTRYCSKETFNKQQCDETAHIVMRELAGRGVRFTKRNKPYNPYSRTVMGDFPERWKAEAPLLG